MNPITRQMTLTHIKVTGHVRNAFDRMRNDDRGQGTLEYVGITIAVLVLVVAVAAIFNNKGEGSIGNKITTAITDSIDKVINGGSDK